MSYCKTLVSSSQNVPSRHKSGTGTNLPFQHRRNSTTVLPVMARKMQAVRIRLLRKKRNGAIHDSSDAGAAIQREDHASMSGGNFCSRKTRDPTRNGRQPEQPWRVLSVRQRVCPRCIPSVPNRDYATHLPRRRRYGLSRLRPGSRACREGSARLRSRMPYRTVHLASGEGRRCRAGSFRFVRHAMPDVIPNSGDVVTKIGKTRPPGTLQLDPPSFRTILSPVCARVLDIILSQGPPVGNQISAC